MAPGSQPILSSTPLQVILYLNCWYFAAFFLASVLMFIYKGRPPENVDCNYRQRQQGSVLCRPFAALPVEQSDSGRGVVGSLPRSGDSPDLLRLEGQPVRARGDHGGVSVPAPAVHHAVRLLPAAAKFRAASGVPAGLGAALLLRPPVPAERAGPVGLRQVQSVLTSAERHVKDFTFNTNLNCTYNFATCVPCFHISTFIQKEPIKLRTSCQ